ncbi:MAG: hypothetical protein U1F43_35920 [Myxococcota bacterium]
MRLVSILMPPAFAACTTTAAIQPRELLVFAKPPAGPGSTRVFVGANGRTLRSTDPDVAIYLVGGGERDFDAPVLVRELGQDRVSVFGADQPPVELSLDQVEKVELQKTELWRGLAWYGVGVLALSGVACLAAAFSGDNGTK